MTWLIVFMKNMVLLLRLLKHCPPKKCVGQWRKQANADKIPSKIPALSFFVSIEERLVNTMRHKIAFFAQRERLL